MGRTKGVPRTQEASVTVTAQERDTGQIQTVVGWAGAPKKPRGGERGSRRVALQHAVDQIEENGGRWKVLCISTVETIATDLRHARSMSGKSSRGAQTRPHTPEVYSLSLIGRKDMLL